MEFSANIDLNDAYNKVNLYVDKISKIISSKKDEIKELEQFRNHLLEERNGISQKINKIKKEKDIQNEKDNLTSILADKMENNSSVKIHYYDDIKSYLKEEHKNEEISNIKNTDWFKDYSVKFGDILDVADHRHYGFTFVGKNGKLENTSRSHAIDQEEGVTVPFNICKYLTDSVSKYKNYDYCESCIVAYELPYHDATVQKYNVKKDHMYEYTCWNQKIEQFDFSKWILVQIDIETGEKSYPKKKRKKSSKKSYKS